MGVLNPNSTSYVHPDEPNLLNVHKAMVYDPVNGEPHLRVTLGSDTITITGDVNLIDNVRVNNSTTNPVPVFLTNELTTSTVYQGTSPWIVTGTVAISSLPEVEIKNDIGNPVPVSATTASNSSVNPIYITGAVTTAGGSAQGKLWTFQVAQGLISGTTSVFKAGYNPSIANNTEESLWSHSVIYPWDSWGAGGTLSCVSASASDTGIVYITGLKASDWTEVTEQVAMNGTTPVVTTNSFIRINSLYYNSSTNSNVGEIHIYRNGGVVGYITPGEGRGQMSQFTVPAGHTAYLLRGNANIGKGNDGIGKFKYRLYGGSFQTAMTFLLFQSTFDYEFVAPLVLPEKTDLDVTLTASVSGTAAGCAYSMILIAN
jgi:hypothetical protein